MNKNKYEDYSYDIINCKNDEKKIELCYKQLNFFKYLEKNSDFDFNKFLNIIDDFNKSKNIEYIKLWLLLINEIINFSEPIKKKYCLKAISLIFSKKFIDEKNPSLIEEIKLKTILNFTNKCTKLISNEDVNKKILLKNKKI